MQKRKLFIHKQGQDEPELIEVEETVTVEELIVRHGGEGHRAWAQDGDELVLTARVVEVVEEHGHIYVGPHAQVEVTVRYETGDKSKAFAPGTRVKTVLKWAEGEHGFGVPESQRGDLELFIRGEKEPVDKAEHIGVLATDHHLRLALAPVDRPQG